MMMSLNMLDGLSKHPVAPPFGAACAGPAGAEPALTRRRFRAFRLILLMSLVGSFGTFEVQAQKPKHPSASTPLSEAQARQLRAEADRDYERQNHADALSKYLRIYANYRNDFEVNRRIGWLCFNSPRSEYQKAIPYLRKAHSLEPENVDVIHDLAKATSWARSYPEAISLYRELVRLAPNIPDYLVELARALAWGGQESEARVYFETYLTRVPSDDDVRLEFARLLAEQKDFAGSMGEYNYILRFHPSNTPARLGLAQILAWTGQLQPSLDEVEKILKANPHHFDARVIEAFDLLWLNRIDQAKPLFLALAKQDLKNQDVQQALRSIAKLEQAKAVGAAPVRPKVAAPPLALATPLQLAEASELQGHFAEAIAYYREYLAKSPNDAPVRFRLSRVLGWNKEYGESEAILKDWTAQHPTDPQGFFQLGRVLSWDQKYEESIQQFSKGLVLNPKDLEARLELAEILSWQKRYPDALTEYRLALQTQPGNKEAELAIGQILIWSGQLDEAQKQLAALQQKYPAEPRITDMQRNLDSLRAQREAVRAISPPASEEFLRVLVQKDPRNYGAHLDLANLLLNRNELPGAVKELRAAAALKPEDEALRLRLGKVLSWNREYGETIGIYREWLQRHPDDQEVRIDLARVLSWNRNYDASLAEYRQILKKTPENTGAQLEMARVLSWARKYPESLEAFAAVLRQGPKNIDAWIGKGRVYSFQTRWRESLEAFNAALALKPTDREALTGKAQALLWSGDTRAARGLLDRLYDENPKDTTVLLSLASAENSSGRPDKALTLLDRAASLEPQNSDVRTLQDQIRSRLKPELRVGWSYVRDTEGLDIWRYQVFDLRFNLHPRLRNFLAFDILPSSAPARVFGYAVGAPPGSPVCGAASAQGCVVYAPRVPVTPYVPGAALLSASDFPSGLLVPASARIRESAAQLRVGGMMQVSEWFSWTASAGLISFRYGPPDDASQGFPSTRERVIYSLSPTFRLSRQWEISFAASRLYWAFTPKALSQTTRMDEHSASITWTPDSRSHVAVSLYHRGVAPEFLAPTVAILNPQSTQVVAAFSGRVFRMHGNGGTVTATRAVLKGEKSQLEAGYDAMAFGYTHPAALPFPEYFLNAGVFTPSFYQRHAGLLRATLGSKYVQWELHGTAGFQQIRQGSDLSFSSTAGSRLDFLLFRKTTLSLGYDYFNTASALQALVTPVHAAGYHSNNVTASLDFRF